MKVYEHRVVCGAEESLMRLAEALHLGTIPYAYTPDCVSFLRKVRDLPISRSLTFRTPYKLAYEQVAGIAALCEPITMLLNIVIQVES